MGRTNLPVIGLALLLSPCAVYCAEQPPQEGAKAEAGISIRVTGLRNDEGSLECGLFVEKDWLRTGSVSGEGGTIEKGVADCKWQGVAPGTYAISTFHDENGDGLLDTGFMRIPTEGTAASNNAYRKFGPPRYSDAKFDYKGRVLELEAEMRYIRGGKKSSSKSN